MEITKHQFKSFEGINELIITHPPSIRTIDIAQHIMDLQNVIEDFRQKEKKSEKLLDITGRS